MTAFEANGQLYEFQRLPFGVTNGVATFQRAMDGFIRDNGLKKVYAYLDDLTVTGATLKEHNDNLAQLLDAAKKCGLVLNEEKSKYRMTSLQILGYQVSQGVVRPDEERLRPLMEMPPPKTKKELGRICGVFAYYARWIPEFSRRFRPMVSCKTPLDANALKAFDELEVELGKASLAAIRSDLAFEVETDASEQAIAGVLSQGGRPVAYMSRVLANHERNYPAVEKEALAIIEAIRKWEHFLKGRHFSLVTDQKPVSYMFDQKNRGKIKNMRLLSWRLELSQMSYDISHKPGKLNVAPDTLSRQVLAAMEAPAKLLDLHKGMGHPGMARLSHFVRSRNLPFTTEEVKEVCRKCRTCAEMKPRFHRPDRGQVIKATRPWERLAIDFKGPVKGKYSYLLIVVDEYSRFMFVFPCKDMTSQTVKENLQSLFGIFGFPCYIHSDRGSSFISRQTKQFLSERGIATSLSSPYHPQGNGQCERVNQTIWKTVKLLLHSKGLHEHRWTDVLQIALHSVRSLLCTSTNATPHERFMSFPRRALCGSALPSWLLSGDSPALLRKFVRNKGDPLVESVKVLDANEWFARVLLPDGREGTVSTSDLAPCPITPRRFPLWEGEELIVSPNPNLQTGVSLNTDASSSEIPLPEVAESGQSDVATNSDSGHVPRDTPELRRSARESRPPNKYGDWE